MSPGMDYVRPGSPVPMQFRVLGPDAGGPGQTDLRRLFRGQRLTAARRSRLGQCGRILAMCGARVVGLAAYERSDRELRVTEMGMDHDSACSPDQIASGLLDALELTCMAGTVRRLVLLPRAAAADTLLRRRGFTPIAEGTSGAWFEKIFA